jgi:hypothetical protein
VDFSECQTVLLYPYVTDGYGYDTGITVSNTTMDPFMETTPVDWAPTYGNGSAVQQTGPCYVYVYTGGVETEFPIGPIGPGSSLSFYLSSKVAGANGYAIAVCEFQNAHGQATIQYLPGDQPGFFGAFETGYLADVLPNPAFYHRTPAGDALGETAIAPYNLLKRLTWQFIKGPCVNCTKPAS